jgi:hypothetical protein
MLLLGLSLLNGCGAATKGSPPSAQSSNQSSSVIVTPAAAQIRAGDMQQFSVTVSGLPPEVTWSVNSVPGGNATVGTIDTNGLYRAPTTLPNPNTVKVAAASAALPSISAATLLTLYNPIPVVISVSPNKISVGAFTLTISGQQFTAGAQVLFAGQTLQTAFSSAGQLVATGTATQAQVGNVQGFVKNPNPGSATSAVAFNVQVTQPPAPPQPAAVTADVVVDASKTVSETGMDDLAAAKNIYASASAPESDGDLYPDWDLISSEFVMKRMRNINGLGDCALDSNGNLTGCSRLNNDLSNIQFRNLTPHVVVGQWAPSSIGGNPLQWGATQWAQYDALCYAIVNYVVNQYGGTGFSEALFEVENEMDITTDPRALWLTTTSSVPQGDPSRFTQFDTVYGHWANAVSLVAQQTPQKTIKIAGPATGFWTVYYGSGQIWQDQIIQKYAAEGLRLDVVSLHQYGWDITNLAKYANSIRNTLIAAGKPQTEIWVTEWGASSSGDSYFGAINASHQGAAWAIAFLLQALKGTVTGGSFLEVRDNQGHDTAGVDADMYEASWNHVEKSVEYPKAIANAFSMVGRMNGTRKSAAVSAAQPNLYAFASSDASSASLIVANYNYLFDWANKDYSDLTTNETVTVAFQNLPFSGPVTVDRYLIDAQTSNLNYWVAAGAIPPSVPITQLQKVESFSASSTGGTLTLPPTQFGQSAVSLWIVHQ